MLHHFYTPNQHVPKKLTISTFNSILFSNSISIPSVAIRSSSTRNRQPISTTTRKPSANSSVHFIPCIPPKPPR